GVFGLVTIGAILISLTTLKKRSLSFALIPFFLTGVTLYSFTGVRPQAMSWLLFAIFFSRLGKPARQFCIRNSNADFGRSVLVLEEKGFDEERDFSARSLSGSDRYDSLWFSYVVGGLDADVGWFAAFCDSGVAACNLQHGPCVVALCCSIDHFGSEESE